MMNNETGIFGWAKNKYALHDGKQTHLNHIALQWLKSNQIHHDTIWADR